MQGAPPLGVVLLELRSGGGGRRLGGLGQLGAHARQGRALLVVRRIETAVVGLEALLQLRDQLRLPLAEPLDLRPHALLQLLEVGGQRSHALLGSLLGEAERLGDLRSRLLLAFGDEALPLEPEPALLLGEERAGVGAGARERAAELFRTALVLLLDHAREPVLGLDEITLDVPPPLLRVGQRERTELGDRAQGQAGGRRSQPQARLEDERDPGADGADGAGDRRALQQCRRDVSQEHAGERRRYENGGRRENCLENALYSHGAATLHVHEKERESDRAGCSGEQLERGFGRPDQRLGVDRLAPSVGIFDGSRH